MMFQTNQLYQYPMANYGVQNYNRYNPMASTVVTIQPMPMTINGNNSSLEGFRHVQEGHIHEFHCTVSFGFT